MKRAVLLIGALTFAGCTVVKEVPTSTVPELAETTDPAPYAISSSDELYIDTLVSEYPTIEREYGEAWLIDLGRLICDAIDEGMTFEELMTFVISDGLDAALVGYITGAAIAIYCPRNSNFFNGV